MTSSPMMAGPRASRMTQETPRASRGLEPRDDVRGPSRAEPAPHAPFRAGLARDRPRGVIAHK